MESHKLVLEEGGSAGLGACLMEPEDVATLGALVDVSTTGAVSEEATTPLSSANEEARLARTQKTVSANSQGHRETVLW